jgi:hypothetical protein
VDARHRLISEGEGGGEKEGENGKNQEALHGRVLSASRARTQENSSATRRNSQGRVIFSQAFFGHNKLFQCLF